MVVLAAAAAIVFAAPPSASGSPLEVGRFVAVCQPSHDSMDDPIVFPRQPGAAHHHQFFGNTRTDARTTPRKLRRKGDTTCTPTADRSAYWIPALHADGMMVAPFTLRAYYASGGKDPSTVQPPPKGLEVIAGDAAAQTAQSQLVTRWGCHTGAISNLGLSATFDRPPLCPLGSYLVLAFSFPDCWNGKDLRSRDHHSHLAYAQSELNEFVCPPTHPVPITALSTIFIYPIRGALTGIEFASGGIYSAHADFMEGWRRRPLRGLVETCIHAVVDCLAP